MNGYTFLKDTYCKKVSEDFIDKYGGSFFVAEPSDTLAYCTDDERTYISPDNYTMEDICAILKDSSVCNLIPKIWTELDYNENCVY